MRLTHSHGRVVIFVFAHVVRPSVPTFQNLAKQNKAKTMFASDDTVGLAEWIIDDNVLHQFSF